MKVAEAQRVLGQLRDTFVAGGAAPAADGLGRLIDALGGHQDIDMDQFLALLGADLDPVAAHSAALRASGTDEASFLAAFEALKLDKRVKTADLDQIGAVYLDLPAFGRTFSSRTAKLKQIDLRFRQIRSFEARGRVIAGVGPWQ